MNAYSEDLRKKIVEAVERGMPKIKAARTFGVGISSVKRYVAAAREGRSLAPKKRPGSKPKLDEGARRLLEADLEERPAATLPERREFLRRVSGVEVSDSTVSRVLKRMGWTRKKIGGCERERRVPESRLAGDGRWPSQDLLRRAAGVRGRVLHQHLVGTPVGLVSARRASALLGATQLGGERDALGVHERERDGPFLGGRRANHQGSFRDLSGATLGALTLSGSGGGDGQSLFSQRREGQGAHRRQRLRADVPAALLARPQPHRRSLRQAQSAAAQSRGAHTRGVARGDGPSAGGDYGTGRLWLLRTPWLPRCGPTAMTDTLGLSSAALGGPLGR